MEWRCEMIERSEPVGSSPAMYLGGPKCKRRSKDQLYW